MRACADDSCELSFSIALAVPALNAYVCVCVCDPGRFVERGSFTFHVHRLRRCRCVACGVCTPLTTISVRRVAVHRSRYYRMHRCIGSQHAVFVVS